MFYGSFVAQIYTVELSMEEGGKRRATEFLSGREKKKRATKLRDLWVGLDCFGRDLVGSTQNKREEKTHFRFCSLGFRKRKSLVPSPFS